MKKFCFLFTVLLSLALCSSAWAEDAASLGNNYCRIDDYGCYVYNEDGQQTYIMFWSEAGRKAVMGDMTAPYENVVAKPFDSGSRLPLLSPPGSGSKTVVLSAANCWDAFAYGSLCCEAAQCLGMNVSQCKEEYNPGGMYTGDDCMDMIIPTSTMKACSVCKYTSYLENMAQGVSPSLSLYNAIEAKCASKCVSPG